jgi:hypothetical protein
VPTFECEDSGVWVHERRVGGDGGRSGCMGMAKFCGEVSRTQMVTWVKVTNCRAMPRLVSCRQGHPLSVVDQ